MTIDTVPPNKKREQEEIARQTAAFLDQGKMVEILTEAPNHQQSAARRPSLHSHRYNPGSN